MQVNVSNERSRVKRDDSMLILLISSAVLTAHQWVMESKSDEKRSEVPVKEKERERLKNRPREK